MVADKIINKKSLYIILSVMILSLAVSLVDAFIRPDYWIKVLVKIFFFLAVPVSYFVFYKSELENFKSLFKFNAKTMIKALSLGLVIYTGIVGGYFVTRGFIDYSNVASAASDTNGVNAGNFFWVSLYISLCNSFLEEFFFRGYGFITLKKNTNRTFAYVFSSALFSIYHVGMMVEMFDVWVLLLLWTALFCGGCVFNWLNESSENIYTSWIAHMFANFGINTVGFILFGIL